MPNSTGQKISQQTELLVPTGAEDLVGSYQGRNFKVLISTLISLTTKITIGLDQVENIAPLDMPISTAQQQALAALLNSITTLTSSLQTLSQTVAGKAAVGHSHAIADTSGLNQLLNDLAAAVSSKANTQHTHVVADITDITPFVEDKITTALSSVVKTGTVNW